MEADQVWKKSEQLLGAKPPTETKKKAEQETTAKKKTVHRKDQVGTGAEKGPL